MEAKTKIISPTSALLNKPTLAIHQAKGLVVRGGLILPKCFHIVRYVLIGIM